MKNCISCYEEINDNAKKCKQCGDLQGWKRHLKGIDTIIAILTLITLMWGVIIIYDKYTIEKISKLKFETITVNEKKNFVRVLIKNEGTVPAVVLSGWMSTYLNGKSLLSFKINLEKPFIVNPNQYLIKNFFQ